MNLHTNMDLTAIPESLLESELFGYEAGAFSGASKKGKKGLIEAADTGTLFLDEIGDMPLNLQVKLLQVLQNKQIMRVGGTEQISVDVRIISATNQNLNYLVEKGKFRLDLYYRLNVIPINIPPLRNRKEDILPLTYLFLAKYTKKYNKDVTLTWDFEQALLRHPWPGNIRELDNLIERIVVLSKNGKIIGRDLLETIIRDPIKNSFNNNDVNQPVAINDIVPLKQALEHVEERLVKMAYNKTKSSYKMAKVLGISQSSAHRRIQKYISKRRSRN